MTSSTQPLRMTADGPVYDSTHGVVVRICTVADRERGQAFLDAVERGLTYMGARERAHIATRNGKPWVEAQTGRDGVLGLHYERMVTPTLREPACFGVGAKPLDPETAATIDGLLASLEARAKAADDGIEKRAERLAREHKAWLAKRDTKQVAIDSKRRLSWDEIRALPAAPPAAEGWRLVTVDRNEVGSCVALFERVKE